jgi:hypothetical protein
MQIHFICTWMLTSIHHMHEEGVVLEKKGNEISCSSSAKNGLSEGCVYDRNITILLLS